MNRQDSCSNHHSTTTRGFLRTVNWNLNGASKFSIICHLLGYRLLIFDSFEGVEYQPGNSFSGAYIADEALVRKHVSLYGEIEVCELCQVGLSIL